MHPSNFTIEGFTERPGVAELAGLGRRFNLPVVEDLGSGFLGLPHWHRGARRRTLVADSVAAGVSLVMFSGDKLLGGPQAGLIVGSVEAVGLVRQHPLMRALRADKMTYAALEATLEEHAAGRAADSIPVVRMIALAAEAIGRRAEALAAQLSEAGVRADVVDGFSTIGGGSAPGSKLATRVVAVMLPAGQLEAALRNGQPPVIARIEDDRVVIDLRTVAPEDDEQLGILVARAAATLFP